VTLPPPRIVQDDSTQELMLAMRALLSRNPCAASFGAETLVELLYLEHWLPCRVGTPEVECSLEALRIEGEVLG
jgi:hypothetical protein